MVYLSIELHSELSCRVGIHHSRTTLDEMLSGKERASKTDIGSLTYHSSVSAHDEMKGEVCKDGTIDIE